ALDRMIEAIYSLRERADTDASAAAVRSWATQNESGTLGERFDRGFRELIPKRNYKDEDTSNDYDPSRVAFKITLFRDVVLSGIPEVGVGRILFNDPVVRRKINEGQPSERQIQFLAGHGDHFHVDVVHFVNPTFDSVTPISPSSAIALLNGWN